MINGKLARNRILRWHLFLIGLLLGVQSSYTYGGQFQDTLYINRGSFVTVDKKSFPALAFNATPDFTFVNQVLVCPVGDTLKLHLVNNDTTTHQPGIWGQDRTTLVGPGAGTDLDVPCTEPRIDLLYDSLFYPKNRYLGLGTMIVMLDKEQLMLKKFFWNFKEHDTLTSQLLGAGMEAGFEDYYPNFFTVNGLSNPDLEKDSTAIVRAKLGDTILIMAANTGQSRHSIHFHGFHTRALWHSDPRRMDWEKDTWDMPPMSAILMRMVAWQRGRYSVHDHNLVAVSGGGVHPNGMVLIMEVE